MINNQGTKQNKQSPNPNFNQMYLPLLVISKPIIEVSKFSFKMKWNTKN